MLVWDDNSENLYPSKTIVNDAKHYLYNITMQEFQEKVDSKLFKLRPQTNTGALNVFKFNYKYVEHI